MSDDGTRFYGKYRGTVSSNIDPLSIGRIQATVPDVLGSTPTSWALPSLAFAGTQSGAYVVPPVNSGVWIEFEQGDIDFPIWSGGWWGSSSEVPTSAKSPPAFQNVVIQTPGKSSLLISDVPGPSGGIVLKTAGGASIEINDTGIKISNGKGATIELQGPKVSVNGSALVVT